jgi:Cys-rich repeat protein
MSKKLLAVLGLSMALITTGCTLYFGPDDDDDQDNRPPGPPGDDGGGGWYCAEDTDCAAGCYCDSANGTCVEAGFCTTDADCAGGLVCDDRSSCVPPDEPPLPTTCDEDADCAAGCFCVEETMTCEESGYCTSDADCPDGQECDETRSTCIPTPPPVCEDLGNAAECTAAGCTVIWNGQNCTDDQTGLPCDNPSSECTCETYTFARCETPAP